MRLLFLAVLRPHTGNAVTARRVRDHLEAAGHVCLLKDAFDFDGPSEIAALIQAEAVEAALALHLYRGGRLLRGHGIPFGIIFGGTDLNEDVNQGEKNQVMGKVLEEARVSIEVGGQESCTNHRFLVRHNMAHFYKTKFAVAFTESMKEMARLQWKHNGDPNGTAVAFSEVSTEVSIQQGPGFFNLMMDQINTFVTFHQKTPAGIPHAKAKIYVQSQGIATAPNTAFNWDAFLQRADIQQSTDNLHVFLLICGLRQVKDPLYLVDAFAEWHLEEPNVYMVIVGPEVDPVFTREVKAKVKRATGVRLIPEMPQDDLHALVKKCFALVNSSVSEGMSAAILEAMDLEVPVLARNIPGNAAVVTHEVTGLLFSDPQEFVQLAKRLVSDPALEKELVANGRQYVRMYHSWRVERDTYQHLVRTLEGSPED